LNSFHSTEVPKSGGSEEVIGSAGSNLVSNESPDTTIEVIDEADDKDAELIIVTLIEFEARGHEALIPIRFMRKSLVYTNRGAMSPTAWMQPCKSLSIAVLLSACSSEEMLTAGDCCCCIGFAREKEKVYSVFAFIVFDAPILIINVPEALVHIAVAATSFTNGSEKRGKRLLSNVSLPVKPVIVIADTIPPGEPISTFD